MLFPAFTKLLTIVDVAIDGTLNAVDEDTMDDKGGNERSKTSSKVSLLVFSPSTFFSVCKLFKMLNENIDYLKKILNNRQ